MLELIEPVRAVLGQVRELTGKEVRFIPSDDLKTEHSIVRIARENLPEHLVFYKRVHDSIINHLIAHECGHILRLFRTPPEKRRIVATGPETFRKAVGEIRSEVERIGKALQMDMTELTRIWYSGIVKQVSSQPADTMIEKWLFESFPDLRQVQLDSLKKQMREALQALTETVRRNAPAAIFAANGTMNYAYFKLLGDYVNPALFEPFKRSEFRTKGEALHEMVRLGYENTLEGDIAMTDKWAEFLGLTGWFYWRDFETVAEDSRVNL